MLRDKENSQKAASGVHHVEKIFTFKYSLQTDIMNIFSIPGLSLAISLIVCWALFAIFCSLVHEATAQVKAERGRFMKTYLLRQFSDKTNLVNWANEMYRQGTVALLSRERRKPSN